MKFPNHILKELKYYVYLYSNPETGEIFYVGKGKGNRVFSHLVEGRENDKTNYINELKRHGLLPKIEILVHGLDDEKTALRVEASIIDLLGITSLTNKQIGYRSSTFGRMSIEQIVSTYDKEQVTIAEPSILIRINKAFRYSMSEIELYDFTRGEWKINPERASNAKFAFAVYEGVVQEIYQVLDWYPAGSTLHLRPKSEPNNGRYEFVGNVASEEVRKRYRYKSVEHYFKRGNANPIMYVNL